MLLAFGTDSCSQGDPRRLCTGQYSQLIVLLPPAGLALGFVATLAFGAISNRRGGTLWFGFLPGILIFFTSIGISQGLLGS